MTQTTDVLRRADDPPIVLAGRQLSRTVLVTLVALLVVASAGGLWWASRPPSRAAVPHLVGVAEPAARGQLADAHLRAAVRRDRGPATAAPGTVIRQSLPDGDIVRRGSTVTLEAVDRRADLPGVVGRSSDEAQRLLAGYGLRVRVGRIDDKAPAGTVLAQNPGAGAGAVRGSTVALLVSQGPAAGGSWWDQWGSLSPGVQKALTGVGRWMFDNFRSYLERRLGG